MDFETITPRTCTVCRGTGVLYYGDKEEYDIEPCECQRKEENEIQSAV